MSREAYVIDGSVPVTIRYTNASAATAGEVIFVAGIGPMIAESSYDADAEGLYAIKGKFQFPIGTAVSISQGDKCYWDKSANAVIKTGMIAEDFYLGRAAADGSATAGYVVIEIDNNRIDYVSAGGVLPAAIIIAAGSHTCVNTTGSANAVLETITAANVLSTDKVCANISVHGADVTAQVLKAKANDATVTCTLNTCTAASNPTAATIDYIVSRAI